MGSGLQLRDLDCLRNLLRVGFGEDSDWVFPGISAAECSPSGSEDGEVRDKGRPRAPHPNSEEAEVEGCVEVLKGEGDGG